jgi:hypothetical protein
MIHCDCEPTLTDALSDPLIQAVMAADGVDRDELEVMLTDVARRFERHSPRAQSWRVCA